jgi:hypothetical protein
MNLPIKNRISLAKELEAKFLNSKKMSIFTEE